MVRRMRFMPRPKVEEAPRAPRPAAPAAEHLPAGEAADQHRLLRLGDVEKFAVHLLVFEDKMVVDSLSNRMPRPRDPQNLPVSRLAPLEVAARPHQLSKNLGKMSAVQHDQPHPSQPALLNAIHNRILHVLVRYMSPPDHHVRLG